MKINNFNACRYFQHIVIVVLLLFLNSCYFTTTYYQNISKYKHPDFSINVTDTVFLTSLIHPDTIFVNQSNMYLDSAFIKFNKFKINDISSTMNLLKKQKIYSLPFNLEEDLMQYIFNQLQARYILIWYFSKLEETDIGKDAEVEIVFDIYDLKEKLKVWNCKSSLSLFSPSPDGGWYIYSLKTNQTSMEKLIDKLIEEEIQQIIKM